MKYLYVTTISMTLDYFLKGVMADLAKAGNEVVAVSSPGPWMAGVRETEGVKVIEVQMERRISPLKDLRSLWRLFRTIRSEKPDIVHSFTPKAGLLAMLASMAAGIKVRIHTFTGLVFPAASGLKRRLLMATDSLTCACATDIIAEGQGVRGDMLSAGITKKDVRVLCYGNIRGVDLDWYDRTPEVLELAESHKVPGTFTFLFVGRVVRDKGITELVTAFESLQAGQGLHSAETAADKTGPGDHLPGQGSKRGNTGPSPAATKPVRLVIVGPFENDVDPLPEETRRKIAGNPAIMTTGEIVGKELLSWYAAADCFVLPSYREGFPNTVLEAGAMGLPSIVTDINGSREIVSDGINGLVVPAKDPDTLRKAMAQMLEDRDFRVKAAAVSRGMIATRFDQSLVRQSLFDFYSSLGN